MDRGLQTLKTEGHVLRSIKHLERGKRVVGTVGTDACLSLRNLSFTRGGQCHQRRDRNGDGYRGLRRLHSALNPFGEHFNRPSR